MDSKFWEVIDHLDWNGHFNDDIIRDRLENQTIQVIEEFREEFDHLNMVVSGLILYRLKTNTLKMTKGKGRKHSDDYMFMDLPAHIIANGQKYCSNFINKNSPIAFDAVECFGYGLLPPDEITEDVGA